MTIQAGSWTWFDPVYHVTHALMVCEADQLKASIYAVLPDDAAEALWTDGYENRTAHCNGRFVGIQRPDLGQIAAIWLKSAIDVPIVAHEAFHVTYWVLGQKGLTLSDSSEEAFSYYLEWLMREIEQRVTAS